MPTLVVGTTDRVVAVREAIEKIHAQGGIGTVNLERCIVYLKEVEAALDARSQAIEQSKTRVLGLD